MTTDILVLNYNGKDLLEKHLPSICNAAQKASCYCRVHVVDNLSSDGSIELLKEKFPSVIIHIAKENKVLCSYNDIVKKIDGDIVVFLNNDIEVDPDFIDYLVKHFDDSNVFFVAPRVMNMDNTFNGGRSYMIFTAGILKVIVDKENSRKGGETCAISCGAFRRSMFSELGGFDDLYLPGIWEEVDLCFRGLKGGKIGIYEPESVIWHDESTTFNREYGAKKKMCLAHRNMFLFMWKNIKDPKFIILHILLLPLRLIYTTLTGKMEFARGFFMALKKLSDALKRRKETEKYNTYEQVNDEDLITISL